MCSASPHYIAKQIISLFVLNGAVGEERWCGVNVPYTNNDPSLGMFLTIGYLKLFFFVLLIVNMHEWNVNLALGSLWALSSDLAFPSKFMVYRLFTCTLSHVI